MAILSFEEFSGLYESQEELTNEIDIFSENEEFNDGLDILEQLFIVMDKKGFVTEAELNVFMDNVLQETEWELNDEVFSSYSEWLNSDYAHIIDESVDEDEEVIYMLTQRGGTMLSEGKLDKLKGMGKKIKGATSGMGKKIKGASSGMGKKIKGAASKTKAMGNKRHIIPGTGSKSGRSGATSGYKSIKGKHIAAAGLGAAAIGAGAYALKKRSDKKKAAAAAGNTPAQK